MNGKRGDHPLNDILDDGKPVFSPEIDALIRRLSDLVPRERLWTLFNWLAPPARPEFERQLRAKLATVEEDAAARGWER